MKKHVGWLVASALMLAGCGEETGVATSNKVERVVVMGDSLADTGTFGFIYSVQGTPGPVIWVDRIAAQYGLPQLCNYYKDIFFDLPGGSPSPATNSQVGCTNFSAGAGRVNNVLPSRGGSSSAYSIIHQITQASTAITYKPTDLVLVDGGGNDAADVIQAYIGYALGLDTASFPALLSTLGVTGVTSANAPAKLVEYMALNGQKLATAVQADIVNKGASKVAILNVPGVQNTPLLKGQLQLVKQSLLSQQIPDAQAQAIIDNFSAVAVQGVNAFNGALATAFAGSNQVVVVDFNTEFNFQLANPAQFALTNVTNPLCPNNGNGINGPNTCTTATFAGNAPVGADPATWWQSYAFSDGFHPTPYGHQLIGQVVSRELVRRGWV